MYCESPVWMLCKTPNKPTVNFPNWELAPVPDYIRTGIRNSASFICLWFFAFSTLMRQKRQNKTRLFALHTGTSKLLCPEDCDIKPNYIQFPSAGSPQEGCSYTEYQQGSGYLWLFGAMLLLFNSSINKTLISSDIFDTRSVHFCFASRNKFPRNHTHSVACRLAGSHWFVNSVKCVSGKSGVPSVNFTFIWQAPCFKSNILFLKNVCWGYSSTVITGLNLEEELRHEANADEWSCTQWTSCLLNNHSCSAARLID